MSTILKKAAVITLAIATFGVYAMPASAQTVEELQAQISALLAQIEALQSQLLDTNTGGGSALACYAWTRDLTLGSTGADVKVLQQFLNDEGYMVATAGVGSPGMETEYFGQLTQGALAEFQAAMGINPPAGYFGPITRSYIETNLCDPDEEPGPGNETPDEGIDVSVEEMDNITVPYNANSITMMTMMFAAGEDAEIDDLTFERKGAGARTDFDKLYIYQDGEKLTSGRSVNSDHEVTFSNLGVDVDDGDVVELDLVATFNASASSSGNVHYFRLTDVDAGDVDVNDLPVMGRNVTLSGTAAGSLTIDLITPTDTSVELGEQGVEIANLELLASDEDIDLHHVILTQYDSADVESLDDFVVKVDAAEVDADVSFNGDEMMIEFDDPYFIEDGDTVALSVEATMTADAYIKGGSGVIELWVDEATDVYGVGRDFGYGVSVAAESGQETIGTAPGASFSITINAAEITFTHNGPAVSDIGLNGEDVVLFDFDADVMADYEVDDITFKFVVATASVDLKNLRLREAGGSVVAGPDDPSDWAAGSTNYHTFTDNFIIEAGNTQYEVVADMDTNAVATGKVTISLVVDHATAAYDLDAENLDTNENVTPSTDVVPASELAGKQLTIVSPDLTISAAPSPVAQTYVVGRTDTVLGAWVLDNNSVSDIDVRSLSFTLRLSSTTDDTLTNNSEAPRDVVSSLALRKGSATGTIIDSESVGTGTNPTIQYSTSGELDVAEGSEEYIYLVGDLKSDYSKTDSEFQATLSAITAKDANNENPQVDGGAIGSYGGDTGKIFDITGTGSISKAEFDGSNPAKNSVIVPGDNVLFSSYRVRASNEDLQLRDLDVDIDDSSNASYFQNAKVYVDGSQVASQSVTGAQTTFEDINATIEKDENTQVQLYADLISTGFGTNLTSGEELKLFLSTTQSDYDIIGLSSGSSVSMTTGSLDDSIRTFQVANSYPTFAYSGSDGTLSNGQKVLYTFTVTANDNGDVELRRLTFDVSAEESATTSDLQVASFELLRGNTVATTTTQTVGASATSETAEVAFNITNSSYYTIEAGETVTFKVRATVSGVESDDANAVSVKMTEDDESGTYQTDSTLDGVFGSGNEDTVWTDTYAQFNGTYLEHPTTSQTLSL